MDITEVLNKTLENYKSEYIDNLLGLVHCDTHDIDHGIGGGLEKEGQEYLEQILQQMGAEVTKDPLQENIIEEAQRQYHEGNLGHEYTDRYNLYGRFSGQGGRSLLFNGHVDTMPAEKEQWSREPHNPVIENGKLYGLGSCDMKAGLMASLMAVKLLQDAKIPLPGDVIFTSVCDEEGGGNGSLVAAMNGVQAEGVVVCEPTDYELIVAHMGWVFFQVEVEGHAVHSGLKRNGVNAIDKAIKIIYALSEMEHQWLLTYKHPLLPAPSGNVGVIQGGQAGSTVPDYCCFKMCIHYLPGEMNYTKVVDDVKETIKWCAKGDPWLAEHSPKVSVYQSGNPFEMEQDHPLVHSFERSFRKVMKRAVPLVGSPAGCDSRTWRNIAGCPTIQYGPGKLAQCHAADEYVEVEQYLNAIMIYAQLILDWCSDNK